MELFLARRTLAVSAIMLLAASAGAVPLNDVCGNRISIGPGTTTMNLAGATIAGPTASCDTYDFFTSVDVWYQYNPEQTGTGILTVSDCSGVGYVMAISVLDTCTGAEIACANDSICGSTLSFPVTFAQPKIIRVIGYIETLDGNSGLADLLIEELAPPHNDRCETAEEIVPGTFDFDDQAAGANLPASTCGVDAEPHRDVWYDYTAFSTGIMTADAFPASGTLGEPASIVIFRNSCTGPIATCSADGRFASLSVIQNERFFIKVSRPLTAPSELWRFRVTESNPSGNGSCGQAVELLAGSHLWNNAGAVDQGPTEGAMSCSNSGVTAVPRANIWFKYIPTADGIAVFATDTGTGNQPVDTALEAYSTSCGGPVLGCNDNWGFYNAEPESYLAVPAQLNVPIYLRLGVMTRGVDYYRSGPLNISLVPKLANDECSGAQVVPNSATLTPFTPITYTNLNATTSSGVAVPGCMSAAGQGDKDVWFSWTPTKNGKAVVSTCGGVHPAIANARTLLTVYKGCGGQEIGCNGDWQENPFPYRDCVDTQSNVILSTITANTQYIIRVAAQTGTGTSLSGPGQLTVEFTPAVCKADFNGSGTVTVTDIFAFLSSWFGGQIAADANDSGSVTVQDIFFFLSRWFAGC